MAQISLVFCTTEIAVFPYLCYSGSIANFQAKKSKIYFFEINRFFLPQTTRDFEDLFRFHFWTILVQSHFWRRMAIFSQILIFSRKVDEFIHLSHYASVADLGGGNDPRIDLRAAIIPIGKLLTLHAIANTILWNLKQGNARK